MSVKDPTLEQRPTDRRSFLKWSGGALLGVGLLAEACKRPEDVRPTGDSANHGDTIVLSGDDVGILNYAFALEQLEAAFYIQVCDNSAFTSIFSSREQQLLRDVRDHEIVHREFLRRALGNAAIQDLTVNFSQIQFNSRRSVLRTARAFEDLGVEAYDGAACGLQNPAFLTLAGKIVSVEARHAAWIREVYGETTFVETDVVRRQYTLNYTLQSRTLIQASGAPTAAQINFDPVNNNGLNRHKSPMEVIAIAGSFIHETIDVSNLPM